MSVTGSLVAPSDVARPTAYSDAAARGAPLPLLAALLFFAALLSLTAAGAGTLTGDVAITHWVQRMSFPGSVEVTALANWAGGGAHLTAIAFVCVFFLAIGRRVQAASLIAAATLLRGANPLLKAIAESPRPTPNLVRVAEHATGAGFPSGHVMGVTLFYGAIIYLAPELIRSVVICRLVQGVAAFMIVATGFARISTGAHWPSDVLGGYLWGTLLLLLLIHGFRIAVVSPARGRLSTSV